METTHLFFDLDGTLTDPLEGICTSIVYALEKLGRPVPSQKQLQRHIGYPLADIFSSLLDTKSPASLAQAIALYREYFGTKGLFENRVYDGIPEMLTALAAEQRYTLLVVTAKPTGFAERILEHFQLDHFFQGIYGSELDGSRVHKADIIAHALESEAVPPAAVVMIGDRDMDIIGARMHKIRSMAVGWGFGTVEELLKAKPDLWAHLPTEIPKVLTDVQPHSYVDEIDI